MNQPVPLTPATPAVFRPRRFSDPVSPLNEAVYDRARMVQSAIAMLDHLAVEIIMVSVDGLRNPIILVKPTRACQTLDAALVRRDADGEKWVANRFGCEIHWYVPKEVA